MFKNLSANQIHGTPAIAALYNAVCARRGSQLDRSNANIGGERTGGTLGSGLFGAVAWSRLAQNSYRNQVSEKICGLLQQGTNRNRPTQSSNN